ncbi:hypothetical protein JXA47_11875, partial [Candidatus Sumerlaeota bacterium]|nr:hypothetical protein [Candidatus Sumerlaeota bacterium]
MAQDPTFADFDSTPVFTDDFNAGGSPGPNGDWIIDADLAGFGFPSALQPPQFVGSLPAGLDAAFAGDPVANNPSGDSAVMLVGNLSADAGTHFGLAYIDLADPVAGSGNNSYETLTNYRFDATIFCLGTGDTFDRFQVGLYVHAGVGQPDLFRAGVFHNTSSDGSGPGFGVRGVATGSQTYPTPNPIANGRWVRMSIMVLGDRIATVVDANGDQILDESDPNEYQVWDRDTADIANGYPAVWTVGEVSSDVKPLFVDDVALYLLPGPPPPPRYLDVASLSVDQIITETELDAYKTANTLPTGVDFRSVGVDPTTGYLVFLDNNDGQISNMAGLMTLDPSDPDPASTLSVLVPAATLATALDGPATQSATNGLRYSADASILVWSEYGSVDDLVRIDDPGGANTVTNLLSQDGTAGIVLTPDETQLMVVTE